MSKMKEVDILLQRLKKIKDHKESAVENHIQADWALLRYINVPEITQIFNEIPKWYA